MEVIAVFLVIAIPTLVILPILLTIHFAILKKRKSASFIILSLIFLFMFPAGITMGGILGLLLDKMKIRLGNFEFIGYILMFTFYIFVPLLLFNWILKKTKQYEVGDLNSTTTKMHEIESLERETGSCEICNRQFHETDDNSSICPKCMDSYFKKEP